MSERRKPMRIRQWSEFTTRSCPKKLIECFADRMIRADVYYCWELREWTFTILTNQKEREEMEKDIDKHITSNKGFPWQFITCQPCRAPKRHPGCHSTCPIGIAQAKANAERYAKTLAATRAIPEHTETRKARNKEICRSKAGRGK